MLKPGGHLVIFGCGYIGSEASRQAMARGLRVTAVTRNPGKAAALAESGVEVLVADLSETDWHDRIRGGADYVLNCVSSGGGGVSGYRRSYLEGMGSLLSWAKRNPIGTLVYTSSTSVYAEAAGGGALRKPAPLRPAVERGNVVPVIDEAAAVNGGSEAAGLLVETENLLRLPAAIQSGHPAASGTRAVGHWFILRLAGIYGPGRHHLLDGLRDGLAEVPGNGARHLNLIHRDDAVAAIWSAFEAPPGIGGEVFNVADDGAATKAEVVAWLAERLGRPAPRFAGVAQSGHREPPDRIIANGKIKRTLGWHLRFPTFREGYAGILSQNEPG